MYRNLPDPVEVFSTYRGRTVTIPFSGGLDSTFLVLQAIEAGCYVELLRFKALTPTVKDELRLAYELERALHAYAIRKGLGLLIKSVDITGEIMDNTTYQQMAWWIANIPQHVSNASVAIAMGWVVGDGTAQLAGDFKLAVESTMRTAYHTTPDVLFPILQWSKLHVLNRMANYPDILKLTWWCENGQSASLALDPVSKRIFDYTDLEDEHRQCGKCHSCIDVMEYFTFHDGTPKPNTPMPAPGSYLSIPRSYPLFDWHTIRRPLEILIRKAAEYFGTSPVDPNENHLVTPAGYTVKLTGIEERAVSLNALELLLERERDDYNYRKLIEQITVIVLKHYDCWGNVQQETHQLPVYNYIINAIDVLFPVPDWMTKEIKNESDSRSVPPITECSVEETCGASAGGQ